MTDLGNLCPEWGDDERMGVVFSPLRSKEVNPESWVSKIEFWHSLICKWCQHNQTCIVDVETLKTAFERNGRTPHCIPEVLQQILESGKIEELARYRVRINPNRTWLQWASGGIGLIIKSNLFTTKIDQEAKFVVPEVAVKVQNDLLQEIRAFKSKPDALSLKHSCFLTENQVNEIVEGKNDILTLLIDRGSIATKTIEGVKMYKFIDTDEIVEFNQVDEGIVKLSQNLKTLEDELFEGDEEVKNLEEKIKSLIKSGSRRNAKSVLMKKKLLERNLDGKERQKINMENLLEEIKSAESNKSVVEAFKAGLEALRVSLRETNTDEVGDTMDEVAEVVRQSEELSHTISAGAEDLSADQETLEQELNEILNDSDDESLLRALERLETEPNSPILTKPQSSPNKLQSAMSAI